MLKKITLLSDDMINRFFADHPTIYLIKYVIYHNKIENRNEHHIIYSLDTKTMNGQHLQR